MEFKVLLVIAILGNVQSFLFEIECPGKVKQCVFEEFGEHEAISIKAFLFEDQKNIEANFYLLLLDEEKNLLIHSKYKPENSFNLITYNNPKAQTLQICIDNFSEITISIEIEVKFGHELASTDNLPTQDDYMELTEKLMKAEEHMEISNDYFIQNENLMDKIEDGSQSLDISLTFVSIATLVSLFIFGAIQIFMIK